MDMLPNIRGLLCGLLLISSSPIGAVVSPDSLWTMVRARLEAEAKPDDRYTLSAFIETFYPDDIGARLRALKEIRHRIEDELFDLPAAVQLAEASIPVARRVGNRAYEGEAQFDLSRYYAALNYRELATVSLDRAIALYETLDRPYEYDYARINRWLYQLPETEDGAIIDRLKHLADTAA